MLIKTNELIGPKLDWAVATCEGPIGGHYCTRFGEVENVKRWRPSTNWAQGGPIIEREQLTIEPSYRFGPWNSNGYRGPTPLIAAMRCYVASKLGYEIDVPKELT